MRYQECTKALNKQHRLGKILLLAILILTIVGLPSCNQKTAVKNKVEAPIPVEPPIIAEHGLMMEQPQVPKYKTMHSYGGWSCPDNIKGFPAVDLQDLEKVPVVIGRLPTKEETRSGASLMYIDPVEIPSARPLDMTLPKLARYYSEHTKKNELVIVIQAVVAEKDTVVGFRYLNGGNGSAWYGEVDFVSDDEMSKLGSTPFVADAAEVNATPAKVWEIITSPSYAKTLGEMFDKNAYVESDWKKDSKVYFKYEPDKIVSTGLITASWENMYIQVDYNFDGYHYVEKFLLLENEETSATQLHITAGPYGEDYPEQKVVWAKWLQKVKELSEAG